jgi:hypothetical protein
MNTRPKTEVASTTDKLFVFNLQLLRHCNPDLSFLFCVVKLLNDFVGVVGRPFVGLFWFVLVC